VQIVRLLKVIAIVEKRSRPAKLRIAFVNLCG
jgi:hypothetical protein